MTPTTKTMTAKTTESDVYDRQIRLWGAEAQKKMRHSRVLYIHVTGTSSEVLKNLVLAGVAATICDPRPASILDAPSPCFFTPIHTDDVNEKKDDADGARKKKKLRYASVAHAVQPLVEELNPLLGPCPILTKEVSELSEDDLKDFAVVIASQIPLEEAVRISNIVTTSKHHHDDDNENGTGCAFYMADCFGMRGAAMMDLGKNFQYRPEQGKKLLDPAGLKEYVPLSEMVKVPLHLAVNRFHKQTPPTWVMYRCLLEYQQQTKQWLGSDDENEDEKNNTSAEAEARTIIEDFLRDQKATLTEMELDNLVAAGMAQVAPVCAVLGGILGNEIIKIISGKGEPANNTLLLDGTSCKAWAFLVKAQKE